MKTNKLKLLLVTDYFFPHWTGIAKSVFCLCKSLQNEFDVTVLTVRFDKKLQEKELLEKILIIRSDFLFTISRSKYSIAIIWDFLKRVARSDVVFVNSPSANIFFFAIISKLFHKKLLIFHQGDLVLPLGFKNKLIEKIFKASSFIAFSLADKLSTYTSDYAEHSIVLNPFLSKFTALILPVYSQNSNASISKRITTITDLKKKNKILFGFAGRFVEEKGFDILFNAISLLVPNLPNVHFVFAGQKYMPYEFFFTKHKDRFEKVKQYITFLGLLDDYELKEFYKNIDFIIAPSRSDCFNMVQAEAMLYGTPAIVANIPGLRYLVSESGFGVLFKTEDAQDLADKISQALKNKHAIMKAEKKILSLLDNEKNVNKIRDFITA